MKLAVSIVSPPGYVHSEAFREVGETIHYELVLTPHDPTGGLPSAAQRSQATVRVTFTGLDH